MRWPSCFPVVVGWLAGWVLLGVLSPGQAESPAPAGTPGLRVVSVWRSVGTDGREDWLAGGEPPPVATGAPRPVPLFRALAGREWPEGWVPLFVVSRAGKVELRRLPPKGQESQADPLCFVRPRSNEPEAARLAGTWTCQARSEHGARHRVRWQLAVDRERVAGRLDQETDYRFAHVTEGTWKTNRLVLKVEYIADRYELVGDWTGGRLRGTWRREDGTDGGTWEAERPALEGPVPELTANWDLVREPDSQGGFRHRLVETAPGKPPPAGSLGRVSEP